MRRSRHPARHGARGLGLLEALHFATITALVGCVAVVAVARYMQHARTAEARGSLTTLAASAAAAFDASDAHEPSSSGHGSRHFPTSSRGSVPKDRSVLSGAQYRSAPYEWDVVPWRELRFSFNQPQSYAYSFESSGLGKDASARAVAEGDLDGDGIFSNYSLRIAPDAQLSARVAAEMEVVEGNE